MVVTLHACDTATDYALAKAVGWDAKVILSVPCCQHELNRQIRNEVLEPVLRYGLLKERMAALITDGLRAQYLEREGYGTHTEEYPDPGSKKESESRSERICKAAANRSIYSEM